MKNSELPAMPVDRETGSDIDAHEGSPSKYGAPTGLGLTKREYAAIQIMAGLASDPDINATADEAATIAVSWTDSLFARLEEKQ